MSVYVRTAADGNRGGKKSRYEEQFESLKNDFSRVIFNIAFFPLVLLLLPTGSATAAARSVGDVLTWVEQVPDPLAGALLFSPLLLLLLHSLPLFIRCVCGFVQCLGHLISLAWDSQSFIPASTVLFLLFSLSLSMPAHASFFLFICFTHFENTFKYIQV